MDINKDSNSLVYYLVMIGLGMMSVIAVCGIGMSIWRLVSENV